MHLSLLFPCLLIVILGADLLGGIIEEGRRQFQLRQRRDSVRRWLRDAQVSH
jgi:hypothetical protein